jgi:hypothetical protein
MFLFPSFLLAVPGFLFLLGTVLTVLGAAALPGFTAILLGVALVGVTALPT